MECRELSTYWGSGDRRVSSRAESLRVTTEHRLGSVWNSSRTQHDCIEEGPYLDSEGAVRK